MAYPFYHLVPARRNGVLSLRSDPKGRRPRKTSRRLLMCHCHFGIFVDADGIVRAKILGFSGSEKWEEWMADLIETTGPGAGTAGAAPEAKTDR